MNLNKCMFIGNLTRDPETRTTSSGKQVCNFTVAVNSKRGGNEETLFVNCVAWERTAEIADKYLAKGSQCYVEGRMREEKYEKKDGSQGKDWKLTVENLQLGNRSRDASDSGDDRNTEAPTRTESRPVSRQPEPVETEDELPF